MPATAQSISGLRLGDPISSTRSVGIDPVARNQVGPFTVQKWRLADHNELSVTAFRDSAKIVYLETNWGGQQAGTISDVPGFFYGKTTLSEIGQRFNSNGFAYKNRGGAMKAGNGLVLLNSYELADRAGHVVTFITKVASADAERVRRQSAELGHVARLDSIIIGDAEYLDALWGEQKACPDRMP